MLWISRGIGRQQNRFYFLAIVVLAADIILTVTDEFGVFDFITPFIDVLLLALLFASASYSLGE